MLTKSRRRIKTADGYKGAHYNSADEGSNVVEVVWEAFTDIMKELNGLRKVSYFVPDTHCAVNRLWKHKHNFLKTSPAGGLIDIRQLYNSNLVKTLPGGHFGVRERHPAQKSLIYTNTQADFLTTMFTKYLKNRQQKVKCIDQSCYRYVTDVA